MKQLQDYQFGCQHLHFVAPIDIRTAKQVAKRRVYLPPPPTLVNLLVQSGK